MTTLSPEAMTPSEVFGGAPDLTGAPKYMLEVRHSVKEFGRGISGHSVSGRANSFCLGRDGLPDACGRAGLYHFVRGGVAHA